MDIAIRVPVPISGQAPLWDFHPFQIDELATPKGVSDIVLSKYNTLGTAVVVISTSAYDNKFKPLLKALQVAHEGTEVSYGHLMMVWTLLYNILNEYSIWRIEENFNETC